MQLHHPHVAREPLPIYAERPLKTVVAAANPDATVRRRALSFHTREGCVNTHTCPSGTSPQAAAERWMPLAASAGVRTKHGRRAATPRTAAPIVRSAIPLLDSLLFSTGGEDRRKSPTFLWPFHGVQLPFQSKSAFLSFVVLGGVFPSPPAASPPLSPTSRTVTHHEARTEPVPPLWVVCRVSENANCLDKNTRKVGLRIAAAAAAAGGMSVGWSPNLKPWRLIRGG